MVKALFSGGGAGEWKIEFTAVVALDHGGGEGVWIRRAKCVEKLHECHGYGMPLTLPKRRGPSGKVGCETHGSICDLCGAGRAVEDKKRKFRDRVSIFKMFRLAVILSLLAPSMGFLVSTSR